jgi:multiple sugar transport system substrate-binding protein
VRDYTVAYSKGCTPPSATVVEGPDNNVAFHNKTIIMTHNATISIAAKWFDDMNNPADKRRIATQAKKNYEELIVTAGFPTKPDGTPMSYRAAVKTGVVFASAKNKRAPRSSSRS